MAKGQIPYVPEGFFGVHTDRYTMNSPRIVAREFSRMQKLGIRRIRTTILWQMAQFWFSPALEDAQAEDAMIDFMRPDLVIGTAARCGIEVMPTIWGTPWWSATSRFPGEKTEPLTIVGGVPRDPADLGTFMRACVRRYGPGGYFWKANPDIPYLPVRWWQPWNEPDRPAFMRQPFDAGKFAAILRSAYEGVKAVDPGATVVLSGLGPVCAESEDLFEKVYSGGVKGWFDVAAIHPFPKEPSEVIDALRLNRRVMERHGDGDKPIMLSQTTWTSALGQTRMEEPPPSTVTEEMQARNLRELMHLVAAHRHELNLAGLLYHGWSSPDREPQLPNSPDSFLWSGLHRVEAGAVFVEKPAFTAFKEAIAALQSPDAA